MASLIADVKKILDTIGEDKMEASDYKKCLNNYWVKKITSEMRSKSSLSCCSIPKKWWKKQKYVKNTETSKIISEFRSGNACIGDRDNEYAMHDLSNEDGRILTCPACGMGYNKTYHLIVRCEEMNQLRQQLKVGEETLEEMFNKRSGQDTEKLHWFLNVSDDELRIRNEKAEAMNTIRNKLIAEHLLN